MQDGNRPETAEFASKMAALGGGPPTFHHLDLGFTWPRVSPRPGWKQRAPLTKRPGRSTTLWWVADSAVERRQ